MKKALYLIIHLAVASLAGVAAAATVELMPDIGAMTGQGYNSAGRLAGDGITGDDVKNWLGSRADGWYTTTGNGDMRWGNATSNTEDQTINLPSMSGTAGVCFGLKMTIENIQDYSGLSFSMNLTPSGTTGTYTYSVWYETRDGEMVELCKGTRNNDGSTWDRLGKTRTMERGWHELLPASLWRRGVQFGIRVSGDRPLEFLAIDTQ